MQNTVPVTFNNKDGHKLFGILHESDKKTRREVGIIILSPGVKSRVAPHRMYVKMARRFCDMGFDVLRFDFYGLGDSEGEINEKFTADFYGSVQVGRYIDDTISAMNWLEKECNVNRFILTGLCGGAITGLLTGTKDERVDSILGLGIPVILDSANIDAARYMTKSQLEEHRQAYIKKIFSLTAWLSFLSFRSDYKVLFKSLLTGLKKGSDDSKAVQKVNKAAGQSDDNFNQYFPDALHKMLSSKKVLLIFSESDRLFWEFEEKYLNVYKQEFEKYKKNFELHITKDANHIFSLKEWQEDMINKSCSWLEDNF